MHLQQYYDQVAQRIATVQFGDIWQGFVPYKFALYNETHCYYNGQHIDKTDDFVANTAIEFNGEYIAIWCIEQEPTCYDALTACIIHEMWHAHQHTMGETRWPNEMHALQHYHYDDKAISAKLQECLIMGNIIAGTEENYQQLLSIRALRREMFGYQYEYEAKVEQIEGSALYIELMALKQLDIAKYNNRLQRALAQIADPNRYLPIRTICYTIGALLLICIDKQGELDYTTFGDTPFAIAILQDVLPSTTEIDTDASVSHCIQQYHHATQAIINQAITLGNIVLEGDYQLVSINTWGARQMDSFVTSSYFVAYQDNNETKVLNGDFVLQLHPNGNIAKVYKLP